MEAVVVRDYGEGILKRLGRVKIGPRVLGLIVAALERIDKQVSLPPFVRNSSDEFVAEICNLP